MKLSSTIPSINSPQSTTNRPTNSQLNYKKVITSLFFGSALLGLSLMGYHVFKKYLTPPPPPPPPQPKCAISDDFNFVQQAQNITSPNRQSCDWIQSLDKFPRQTVGNGEISPIHLSKIEALVKKTHLFEGLTFIEKLEKDCKTLQAMNLTYDGVADHLQNLINLGESKGKFTYDPSVVKDSEMGRCSKTQQFATFWSPDCCPTGCGFECLHRMYREYNIFGQEINIPKRLDFKNKETGKSLDISSETVELIRQGFFDGTDPAEIASFLTSHPIKEIENAIGIHTKRSEVRSFQSLLLKTEEEILLPRFKRKMLSDQDLQNWTPIQKLEVVLKYKLSNSLDTTSSDTSVPTSYILKWSVPSSAHEIQAVLRNMRGESLESISEAYKIDVPILKNWRKIIEAPLLSPLEPQAPSNNYGRQQPYFSNSTLGIKQ